MDSSLSVAFRSIVGNWDDAGDVQKASRQMLFAQACLCTFAGITARSPVFNTNLVVTVVGLLALELATRQLQQLYAALLALVLAVDASWLWGWGALDGDHGIRHYRFAFLLLIAQFLLAAVSSALWYKMWRLGMWGLASTGYTAIGERPGGGFGGTAASGVFPPPDLRFGGFGGGMAASGGVARPPPPYSNPGGYGTSRTPPGVVGRGVPEPGPGGLGASTLPPPGIGMAGGPYPSTGGPQGYQSIE
eukprot:jgi/Mesvir1/16264/Mv08510-RA.1